MTAAEVARELNLNHANASYHLRQLHAAGAIEVAGEERIRGGVAKRYRYDVNRELTPAKLAAPPDAAQRRMVYAAMAAELRRRAEQFRPSPGRSYLTDADLWVDPELWGEILARVAAASGDLHRAAQATPYARHDPGQRDPGPVRDGARRDGARRDGARRVSTLAPLRLAPFRNLAVGRVITMLGNAMAPIALAFAVLDLTGSARDLGLVVGARSLTNVVFLLFGGVVADRFPRQHVMVVSSVLAAVTQAAVAALVLTGSATIALLIGLAALNGLVSAFAFPAAAALMGQTVPDEIRKQANALSRLGIGAAMIVGAAAARRAGGRVRRRLGHRDRRVHVLRRRAVLRSGTGTGRP